jgi:DNA-binding transcriptional LysR family regulator
MLQSQVERGIDLAVVAEPYSIPDASRGAGDLLGSDAILWIGVAGNAPEMG